MVQLYLTASISGRMFTTFSEVKNEFSRLYIEVISSESHFALKANNFIQNSNVGDCVDTWAGKIS